MFARDIILGARDPMKFKPITIALVAAVGLGQSQDADSPFRLAFEVASIKPDPLPNISIAKPPGGGLVARGIFTKFLIALAYDVKEFQILDGPSWITREQYSIDAKPGDNPKGPILSVYLTRRQKEDDEWRLRIQSLLADRFQLRIHKETREEQVYSLVVAKNGPKFRESKFNESDAEKGRLPGLKMHPYELIGTSVDMRLLAEELSRRLNRNVVDKTGLNGEYDFDLRWAPDAADGDSVPDGPSIFTAVQEQLGLKLESGKAPVDAIVIDHIEKPSPN
jgi:bla regulator protein BlaR1